MLGNRGSRRAPERALRRAAAAAITAAVATGPVVGPGVAAAGEGDDKHQVLEWTQQAPSDSSDCTFRAEGHLVEYAGTVAMRVPDTAQWPCVPYGMSMIVHYRDRSGDLRSVTTTSDPAVTSFSATYPDVRDQFSATVTFTMPWGPSSCGGCFPLPLPYDVSRTVTPK